MISNKWNNWHHDWEDECNVREKGMSEIYPLPDKMSFNITRDSLKKPVITKYRGAMHEALYVEEIEKNYELLKANQTRLKMCIKDQLEIHTSSGRQIISKEGKVFAEV